MHLAHPKHLLALALTALSACTSHDNMMSDHGDLLEEHVAAYQSELDSHADRVAAASSLETISTIEQEHNNAIAAQMNGMRHEAADMMGCTDAQDSRPHSEAIMQGVGDMEQECERHEAAMMEEADVDAAQAEEIAHHRTVTAMMDGMREHMASMMNDMASMPCSHHED